MFLDFLHPGVIDVSPAIPPTFTQWDDIDLQHCPVPRVDDAANPLIAFLLLTIGGSVLADNATDFFDDF
jgi:hypothetical protein